MRLSTVFKLVLLLSLWVGLYYAATGQKVVDRSVATVSDGIRTELITYSDLLWQLALQPGTSIDPPSKDDLQRALQTLINQRLFALEAERIPRNAPTDQEIADEITDLLSHFPSPVEFERRLNRVGFTSVKDDNFERIIAERVAIKKYLDFRFRSFIVITPADEEKYYRDVYVPDFRRRFPGVVVPSLESKRSEIRNTLTETRVADQIETFLDEAKRRAQIVILADV
ncbi:MAG TPA: hypothetical protein VEV84_08630 [Pyrinomonadaceae bacterium]|nr:hypothetical protein [Pyrinomonadaceae bacterium]